MARVKWQVVDKITRTVVAEVTDKTYEKAARRVRKQLEDAGRNLSGLHFRCRGFEEDK